MDDPSDDPFEDPKEVTHNLIETHLKADNPFSLQQVKKAFMDQNKFTKLSPMDASFIEEEYMKICSRLFMQDMKKFIKSRLRIKNNTKNVQFIKYLFNLVNNMKNLKDLTPPLDNFMYYKHLMEDSKLIPEEAQRIIVKQFKSVCLQEITAYSSSIEQELTFLEAIINFLNMSVIGVDLTSLKEFCSGGLSFIDFLKRICGLTEKISGLQKWKILDEIKYLSKLKVLKEKSKDLLALEGFIFLDTIKSVLSPYAKPTEAVKKYKDGRNILEVNGKFITVSEIIEELKNNSAGVEEFRFIGAEIFYIDTDLNEFSYGKSVVVYVKTSIIHGQITWNLSGKSSPSNHSSPAETNWKDGHGKNGSHGLAGESGGNLLFLADDIKNARNFKIISNGGNGSTGQDGGTGRDGANGTGITKSTLDSDYSTPARMIGATRKRNMDNIKNRMKSSAAVTHEDWAWDDWTGVGGCYLRTTTHDNCQIIFSFYGDFNFKHSPQAYFLYRGSPGGPGGRGGEAGLGGQGGFCGEIVINHPEVIIMNNTPGKKGNNGKGGLYGHSGKNGWDIGYTSFVYWKYDHYHGLDYNRKIEISHTSYCERHRIWCLYHDGYAEFRTRRNSTNRSSQVRNNYIQNLNLQTQAKAVRKKTMTESQVVAEYSHFFTTSKSSDLKQVRENMRNVLQEALKSAVKIAQEREYKTEVTIQRRIDPPENNARKRKPKQKAVETKSDETSSQTLIEQLEENKEEWHKLKKLELNWTQLKQLFELSPKINSIDFDKLLVEKSKFAVVKEVAFKIPTMTDEEGLTEDFALTAEEASKFLVQIQTDNSNNNNNKILGILNDKNYFQNNYKREQIITDSLKRSVGLFIFESDNHNSLIKKYRTDFEKFKVNQKTRATIFLESLLRALNFRKIPNLNILKSIVEGDKFLRSLYTKYVRELNKEFDWEECCKNSQILQLYENYVKIQASLSASCREILASEFNVNLRLFEEEQDEDDERNKFVLINDHNPSAIDKINVLRTGKKFILLHFDQDYYNLLLNRNKTVENFRIILNQVYKFRTKKQFDEFVRNPSLKSRQLTLSYYSETSNEDWYVDMILTHFPVEEVKIIRDPLKSLGANYIGTSELLRLLYNRFQSDGRHVKVEILLLLINSVINSINEHFGKDFNIFLFIVAGFTQRDWIKHLLLIQIENHFKQKIPVSLKFDEHLTKLNDHQEVLLLLSIKFSQRPLKLEQIREILYLLSCIPPEEVNVENLELSEWPYALKLKYWTHKLKLLTKWSDNEDLLESISNLLLSLENSEGEKLVEDFLSIVKNKVELSSEESKKNLLELLSCFYKENPKLNENVLKLFTQNNISQWLRNMKQKFPDESKERDIPQLVEIINGNGNTSENIKNNLTTFQETILKLDEIHCKQLHKLVVDFDEDDIKKWLETKSLDTGDFDEILAVIVRGIELKKGFRLRHTSQLSILSLLKNSRKTLLQMATGEGKTLVIVAMAIIKVLLKEKVDIITNSSVLAKRDAEENKDVYQLFQVQVAHNCSEEVEDRKRAYSNNHVVYGDLTSFQRDYLLDRFYDKNIIGDRNFQNIFVDEVDSMLLDGGNNILYLSQDLIGLDTLESLYVYIWQIVNRPVRNLEEFKTVFDFDEIKKIIKHDLYGLVNKEEIYGLDSRIDDVEADKIWTKLLDNGIIASDGRLIIEKFSSTTENLVKAEYQPRLKFLLNQKFHRDRNVRIPKYLLTFVDQHLDNWINSAIQALYIQEHVDYVIDVDRTNTSPDRHPHVIILDKDTGTDQLNSQWDEALHQFLQLKHGCRLSLQSLKSVFISNISYFKLYQNLYGLTGTLGSRRERNLLEEIYTVDFVTMPNFKPKKFKEEDPKLCKNDTNWLEKLSEECLEICGDKNRSILLICASVKEVEDIYHRFLSAKDKFDEKDIQIHTYSRDYEEFDVTKGKKKLESKHIIIATNLAGRGTDIKITKQLLDSGGLHVVISYLPNNVRIEQQAFGRAARKGEPGSGRLIIKSPEGQMFSKIVQLKKERDLEELERISKIKFHYDTQIALEEQCFGKFQEVFQIIVENLKNQDKDLKKILLKTYYDTQIAMEEQRFGKFHFQIIVGNLKDLKEILLETCLNKWAFWLDSVGPQITKSSIKHNQRKVFESLENFLGKLKNLNVNDLNPWIRDSPVSILKTANYYVKAQHYLKARNFYNQIITREPDFCEAARYLKAFTLFKTKDLELFKNELKAAEKVIDAHINSFMKSSRIIDSFKRKQEKSLIQLEAFSEQKKHEIDALYAFKSSILQVLGQNISYENFTTADIDHYKSYKIYHELLNSGILQKSRVKAEIPEEVKSRVARSAGLRSSEDFGNFIKNRQGKEFVEEEFQDDLMKSVDIASKEEFWKILVDQGVLSGETHFVIVNREELEKIKAESFQLPPEQQLNFEKNYLEINFNHEFTDEKYQKCTFEKKYFKSSLSKEMFEFLKKSGVLYFNKKALIDLNKFKNVNFYNKFDSLIIKDLAFEEIPEDDANMILQELLELKVLTRKSEEKFKLNVDFKTVADLKISCLPVYEDAVKIAIFRCFAYRICAQKIQMQLDEKHFPVRTELLSNPHHDLMYQMLEEEIIQPVNVKPGLNIDHISIPADTEEVKKELVNTLKQSRSCLENFEKADCNLKPLLDGVDNKNAFNLSNFILNGNDHLLEFQEAKWTLKMILQSLAVLLLSVIQIAIGAAISLFTAGALTYLGTAFISEGISDIIFSVSCFRSGYFSWKDYGRHKLVSLAITVISCGVAGVGVWFFKGAKVVNILANSSWKVATNQIVKQVAVQTVRGVANAAVFAGIDIFIERCLKAFCEDLAEKIFVTIGDNIDNNQEFNESLDKLYGAFDENESKRVVGTILKNIFTHKNLTEKWLPVGKEVFNSTLYHVEGALKSSNNKRLSAFLLVTRIISSISVNLSQIVILKTFINSICHELSQEILKKVESKKGIHSMAMDGSKAKQFKIRIKEQVKELLREKSGKVVHQYIVSPLLQEAASLLLRRVEDTIKSKYRYHVKEKPRFIKEKAKFLQDLKKNQDENAGDVDKVKSELTQDYHEKMLELLDKVKSKKIQEKILQEVKNIDLPTDRNELQEQINKIVNEKQSSFNIELQKLKTMEERNEKKTKQILNQIVQSLQNDNVREHFRKIMEGEPSSYKIKKDELNAKDRTKLPQIERFLTSHERMKIDMREKITYWNAQQQDFHTFLKTYDRIKDINDGQRSYEYESKAHLIPDFVLTLKYLQDNKSKLNTYPEDKRLNTVSAALKDNVLYLACNYHTEIYDENAPIQISNVGWGNTTEIAKKLNRFCKLQKISEIVFVEPKNVPSTSAENRAPHAEMQLLQYAKDNNINFDKFDVSKPPCSRCWRILDEEKIKFDERPRSNLLPKNWSSPNVIEVKEAAKFNFKKDFPDTGYKPPRIRIPQVIFGNSSWIVVGGGLCGDLDKDEKKKKCEKPRRMKNGEEISGPLVKQVRRRQRRYSC